uniref:Uncharacterized protein n=1 Tax=uncultured marine virus TaxID=186617 RepID=A0A0F7L978_9VIRU|nr:hypothetical protein [uncultured marine virus]
MLLATASVCLMLRLTEVGRLILEPTIAGKPSKWGWPFLTRYGCSILNLATNSVLLLAVFVAILRPHFI